MKRKVLFILLAILSGGVMLSACKKDKSIEPKTQVDSEFKDVSANWEPFFWAAMHSVGTDPSKHATFITEGDAADLILDVCYDDPNFVPQTGYFTDTIVFRWEEADVMYMTSNYFWYHLYQPGEKLPDVYNEYYSFNYWKQYAIPIKMLVNTKFQEILAAMPSTEAQHYRIKTIGFGNDYYLMPNDPMPFPNAQPGDFHCLHWFTYGYWVDEEN